MKGITKITNLCFGDDGVRMFRSYNIGDGQFMSKEEFQKLGNKEQETTNLHVITGFSVPHLPVGKISNPKECERVETSRNDKNENLVTDTSEDHVEIQENVLEISEPNNNNESEQRLQSSTFFCSAPGCSKIYQSYNSLKNHILTGKHEFKNTISTYDNIRNKWAENCQSMSTEAMPQTFTDTNLQVVNKEAVAIGEALKKDKKIIRFSSAVKLYLTDIFNEGQQKCTKTNSVDVSRKMKKATDENGILLFSSAEYLQPNQITSFFSRLTMLSKQGGNNALTNISSIDDPNLTAILEAINENEIRNELQDL